MLIKKLFFSFLQAVGIIAMLAALLGMICGAAWFAANYFTAFMVVVCSTLFALLWRDVYTGRDDE